MYTKFIEEYNKKINQYKRTIGRAEKQNKKRILSMVAIFGILVPLSFAMPEPLFKLPLVWPAMGVAVSGLLSLPFYNAYKETCNIIEGAREQIGKLESDISKMEAYDRAEVKNAGKSHEETKYSYDRSKQTNREQVVMSNQNGRGRR